jgi:hypothetical protein
MQLTFGSSCIQRRKFQRLVNNVLEYSYMDICVGFDSEYMKELLDWELNGPC